MHEFNTERTFYIKVKVNHYVPGRPATRFSPSEPEELEYEVFAIYPGKEVVLSDELCNLLGFRDEIIDQLEADREDWRTEQELQAIA